MFPFKFHLSGNNSGFFNTKMLLRVMLMIFDCYGQPLLFVFTQAVDPA